MFLIWLFVAGCGSHSPFANGPGDVLKKFVMAANAGKYSEMKEFFSADLNKAFEGPMAAMGGGLKAHADEFTKNGKVQRVEIVKENIRGEGAKVTANIYYTDGTVRSNDETNMINEHGVWKVAP